VSGAVRALLDAGRIDVAVGLPETIHWDSDSLIRETWAALLADADDLDGVCTCLLAADPGDEAIAALATQTARALDERTTSRLLAALTDTETADGVRILAAWAAAHARDLTTATRWVDAIDGRMYSALAKAYVAGTVVRHDPAHGTPLLKQAEKAIKRTPKPERPIAQLVLSWAVHPVDPARSDALLTKVTAMLRAETGDPNSVNAALILAMKLAELGDSRALDLIDIPEAISLRPLVITLAGAGCFDAALRAAQAEVIDRDRTLMSLSTALAADGRIEPALQAMEQVAAPETRREIEQVIAEILTKARRFPEAIQILSGSTEDILLAFADALHHAADVSATPIEHALIHAIDVTAWYDPAWSNAPTGDHGGADLAAGGAG
jgi:hypothetical protein